VRDRPVLIDRFCGEGGAAAGYVRRGFRVIGVDDNPKLKARYLESGADRFVCADANTWEPDEQPDAEHYSPPCHDHSELASRTGLDHGTAWMLPHAIERARDRGIPYVIENVAGAGRLMDGALMLCGSMFGLGAHDGGRWRILKRHRLFLTSFPIMAPPDMCSGRPVGGVYGTGGGGQMTRGWKFHPGPAAIAMGMPWGTRAGLSQAIPPAFTEYLADGLLAQIGWQKENAPVGS
jgi:DNA (cytosine-5)-methyltransferase 1